MIMTCEIVRDLIPMYVDGTASDETGVFVKQHLKECFECDKYCRSCKKAEEKSNGFLFGKEAARRIVREKTGDITELDRQFASLSRKLKLRKIRNTVICILALVGVAVYVTTDIVNTIKRKERGEA